MDVHTRRSISSWRIGVPGWSDGKAERFNRRLLTAFAYTPGPGCPIPSAGRLNGWVYAYNYFDLKK